MFPATTLAKARPGPSKGETFSRDPSGEKLNFSFPNGALWCIFVFLSDGGAPRRRGARGSLPPPSTPPSRRALARHIYDACRYRAVDARTKDWRTISVNNSPDLISLRVHRLKPATRYEFMVAARSLHSDAVQFSSHVNATTKRILSYVIFVFFRSSLSIAERW